MTKSPSGSGDPVDLGTLSFPQLEANRSRVLSAVAPPGLRVAPTTQAIDLYRGMLLDAALDGASAGARHRAARQLVYVSALWGAVRPTDWLPEYRLHMCERPAGLGHLVQYWQEPLASVLPEVAGDGLILDLRSSEYLHAWRPRDAYTDRWVALKPVRDASFESGSGGSTARIARGRVLHRILNDGMMPRDPVELADALEPAFRVQLRPPAAPQLPWELRFVQPA